MSETEEEWKRLWYDKTTEPYTILHVERVYIDPTWGAATRWHKVYYRSYNKRSRVVVEARDELDAYIGGLKRIKSNKRKTDQLNARKKEQTK